MAKRKLVVQAQQAEQQALQQQAKRARLEKPGADKFQAPAVAAAEPAARVFKNKERVLLLCTRGAGYRWASAWAFWLL